MAILFAFISLAHRLTKGNTLKDAIPALGEAEAAPQADTQ